MQIKEIKQKYIPNFGDGKPNILREKERNKNGERGNNINSGGQVFCCNAQWQQTHFFCNKI